MDQQCPESNEPDHATDGVCPDLSYCITLAQVQIEVRDHQDRVDEHRQCVRRHEQEKHQHDRTTMPVASSAVATGAGLRAGGAAGLGAILRGQMA
jgi:hypothetical protein